MEFQGKDLNLRDARATEVEKMIRVEATRNSKHIKAAIESVVRLYVTGDSELINSVIEHVYKLLIRHMNACKEIGMASQIGQTIIEGIEDFRLKELTNISAQDIAPLEVTETHYFQYSSPRKLTDG
jgi:hypothetical protein